VFFSRPYNKALKKIASSSGNWIPSDEDAYDKRKFVKAFPPDTCAAGIVDYGNQREKV